MDDRVYAIASNARETRDPVDPWTRSETAATRPELRHPHTRERAPDCLRLLACQEHRDERAATAHSGVTPTTVADTERRGIFVELLQRSAQVHIFGEMSGPEKRVLNSCMRTLANAGGESTIPKQGADGRREFGFIRWVIQKIPARAMLDLILYPANPAGHDRA